MTLRLLSRRTAAARLPMAIGLISILLLVVACTGAPAGLRPDRPVGGAAPTDAPTDPDGDQVLRDDALIIRTGETHIEVADLAAAITGGRQAIDGMGGYVELSEEHHGDGQAWAQVTYRLPVAQWDAALAAVRGLGRVLDESTDARDVTAEVVDLDARLANLRATEEALQAIMVRAETIDDVLAVQRELTEVRGEIESLTAQRDRLADQAAMSTLTVTYSVPVEPISQATEGWDLGREVSSALASLVVVLQRLASFGIWLAIVVVPVVVPVLLVVWVVYRLAKRRTRPA